MADQARTTASTWSMLAVLALTVGGCGSPLHLAYDFGRAYTEAFIAQADLTRPTIASSRYYLYGVEAAEIRIRVRDQTTDAESGQAITGGR